MIAACLSSVLSRSNRFVARSQAKRPASRGLSTVLFPHRPRGKLFRRSGYQHSLGHRVRCRHHVCNRRGFGHGGCCPDLHAGVRVMRDRLPSDILQCPIEFLIPRTVLCILQNSRHGQPHGALAVNHGVVQVGVMRRARGTFQFTLCSRYCKQAGKAVSSWAFRLRHRPQVVSHFGRFGFATGNSHVRTCLVTASKRSSSIFSRYKLAISSRTWPMMASTAT